MHDSKLSAPPGKFRVWAILPFAGEYYDVADHDNSLAAIRDAQKRNDEESNPDHDIHFVVRDENGEEPSEQ